MMNTVRLALAAFGVIFFISMIVLNLYWMIDTGNMFHLLAVVFSMMGVRMSVLAFIGGMVARECINAPYEVW